VKTPGWIVPLVVADFFFTLGIYLVALYLVAAGTGALGGGLEREIAAQVPSGEVPALEEGLSAEDGGAKGTGQRETGARAIPGFQDFYLGLIPSLRFDGVIPTFLPGYDLWARSWVLIFSIMTTFITSVWLWLVLVAGPFAKLLVNGRGKVNWLGKLTQVERVPFTVFGMMVAALLVFIAVPVSMVWQPSQGGQDADEAAIVSGLDPADQAARQFSPGSTFRDCDVCPEMVVIPAGSFQMGDLSGDGSSDEIPVHAVTIPQPLAVGKFEVTWKEWEACVAAGGCDGAGPQGAGGDNGWGKANRPVINVDWNDAKAYAAWLSKKTGHPYRLLSEAEWEYAARAGTKTKYAFGDTITTRQANFSGDNYLQQTVPVGSYQPNAWGLYDMHGNVWEWVEDCYHGSYSGAPSNGSAWATGSCASRVIRGGSWVGSSRSLRSAGRVGFDPSYRDSYLGFRITRTLPE